VNKETSLLLDYIDKSGFFLEKIKGLRVKHNNVKDFQAIVGYVVMEIVSKEKKFMHLKRNNIELDQITMRYF